MGKKRNASTTCIYCQKTFMTWQSELNSGAAKFCSHSCAAKCNALKRGLKLHNGTKKLKREIKKNLQEEFLNNINIPINTQECWNFKLIDGRGYGIIYWKGKPIKAHRFSYEHYVGTIPKGMMICHHCDIRDCVNPSHLYAGNAQNNAQDREDRKRGRDCKGSKSHFAKINESQAKEIKLKLFQGINYLKIAKEYNVGEATVRHIKLGETWRHVKIEGD